MRKTISTSATRKQERFSCSSPVENSSVRSAA
jgi:hypothetical protein